MKDMQVIESLKHVEIQKRQEFLEKTVVKQQLRSNLDGFFMSDTWEILFFFSVLKGRRSKTIGQCDISPILTFLSVQLSGFVAGHHGAPSLETRIFS